MEKRYIAGVLAAIVLLLIFFRNTQWTEVLRALRQVDITALLMATGVTLVTVFFRALRWRALLFHLKYVRVHPLVSATSIGIAVNSVSPRVGEIVRAYILARNEEVPVGAALATVVLDRLFDFMTLILLISVNLLLTGASGRLAQTSPELSRQLEKLAGALLLIFLAAAGFLVFLKYKTEKVRIFVGRLTGMLSARIQNTTDQILQTFASGLGILQNSRRLLEATAYSVALWSCIELSYWLVLRGFGYYYSVSDITFLLAFLVVGAAIPTPASAGGFHALGQFALEVFFNVEHSATIAPIMAIHAIAFFPLTFLGIYYLFQEGLWNRGLKRSAVEKLRSTGPFR